MARRRRSMRRKTVTRMSWLQVTGTLESEGSQDDILLASGRETPDVTGDVRQPGPGTVLRIRGHVGLAMRNITFANAQAGLAVCTIFKGNADVDLSAGTVGFETINPMDTADGDYSGIMWQGAGYLWQDLANVTGGANRHWCYIPVDVKVKRKLEMGEHLSIICSETSIGGGIDGHYNLRILYGT